MLEFLRKEKHIQVGKLRVKIYRKGVGFFYPLLLLFLKLRNENNLEKNVFYLTELSRLAKLFFHVENFFFRAGLRKLNPSEFLEILAAIVDFNLPGTRKKREQGEVVSEKEVSENFYFLVSQVIFYTGWELDYILENIDYPTLYILFLNIRYKRLNNAMDAAGAWDLQKYRKALYI